jgi:glycosyltransferase involved in cell wall biosynthesis
MRVAINLWQYVPGGTIGGHENYIRAVVAGIANDRGNGGHTLTLFAPELAHDVLRGIAPSAEIRAVAQGIGSIAEAFDPAAYDALLCPQMGLDPPLPGLPSVAMVCDLIPRMLPHCFDPELVAARERLVAATVREAGVVLTVSEFSRGTILDTYAIDPDRVVVTHCDAPEAFRGPPPADAEPVLRALGVPSRYLLFPANYWRHKNHANVLAAVALLRSRRPGISLVLTGADTADTPPVRARIAELGLGENVLMLPYQPQAVMVALMANAQALLYPTLMEGFGIPPLEAFHVGTPVVASGLGGAAEVIGDAAVIIDPEDPHSIAAGIVRVLDDPDLRARIVERGRRRTTRFSWARTVATVLESLERVVAEERAQRYAKPELRQP